MSDLKHVQDADFIIGHIHVPYTVCQSPNNTFVVEIGAVNEDEEVFASIEIVISQTGGIEVFGKNKNNARDTFCLGNVITEECK